MRKVTFFYSTRFQVLSSSTGSLLLLCLLFSGETVVQYICIVLGTLLLYMATISVCRKPHIAINRISSSKGRGDDVSKR